MSKYNEQFQLSVVQEYLAGTVGYTRLAKRHGLTDSTVKKWVGLYRIHGVAGLAKKFTHYSAEFRLSVLQHMWDCGLSHRQVAAVFNIRNAGCITQWVRCYQSDGLDALTPRNRGKPKKVPMPPDKPESLADAEGRTHDELVAEVNQLRMEVAYLKKLQALVQAQQQQRSTTPKKRS